MFLRINRTCRKKVDHKRCLFYITIGLLLYFLPHTAPAQTIPQDSLVIYKMLSDSYAKAGNARQAYQYFSRYRMIKDQLFTKEKERTIGKLEQDYETLKKDKEILQKQTVITWNNELAHKKTLISWGIATAGLLVTVLVLVSLRSYRSKQQIYRKMQDQMQHRQQIEVLKASLSGENKERENIGLSLQKEVHSILAKVHAGLASLEEKLPRLKSSEEFAEAVRIVKDVEKELQETSFALAPAGLADQGLETTIQNFIADVPASHELHISFIVSGTAIRLSRDRELSIFRIVQELIQNIIKHAGATRAYIQLTYTDAELSLTVNDNGKGISQPQMEQGLGLQNIRESVATLNGRLSFQNNEGAIVQIVIPTYPKS